MAVSARRRPSAQPRGGFVGFLRETYDELRKVVWPTPPELYRYTVIVVITTAVIALFITVVDASLQELTKRFIYGAFSGQGGGISLPKIFGG
ncbi:MAG: preprotein translocase subunit SecE [Candidatus Dormibacteraeota bacterium]|uniref:preprotein translocase subunit SecE n=1 Tax=Candidatus Dormibacter sp. TaxID=2973982 RepID=UPI000DB869DF|nr:preprotein translocase subunit SecE [Candidatus Dormibacteraeota bacterium]PZR70792.1 MAG: preprotein translocase subunit SecE [Candidatus Dormibacteraeota bacterium]